jgi:uncharacterized protein YndB with AHSA1/START domain
MSHDLKVTKLIQAPREKVFAAWTDPEIMKHWFFPQDMAVKSAESDVRIGGAYRATMVNGDHTFTAYGTYTEIVAGERLVFTHHWDEGDRRETLVTVELTDQDGGTLVTLTHSGLASAEAASGHREGWASTLENLGTYFRRHA